MAGCQEKRVSDVNGTGEVSPCVGRLLADYLSTVLRRCKPEPGRRRDRTGRYQMGLIIDFILDFGWWITGMGVVVCMIVGLWGFVRWSKAKGDSGKGGGARLAMFGGGIGVVAAPVSLILFRIVFADVFDPYPGAGSPVLDVPCDVRLRTAAAECGPV